MKAWYSKVRDTELIDGSVRADYVVTFETDNAELKREVEKYLQGIMDKDEPQNYCDDCLYTDTCDDKAFFYACTSKATISKMEQVEEPTEITYQNCSDALLKMWMDNVLTDAEYNRIMDKLNNAQRKDEPQTKCYLRTSCDHYKDKQACGRCREYNLYSHTKDEPQTEAFEEPNYYDPALWE